jgi:predicted Rossmann fold nucleotide-binding protein DprA/Smf involved in DNA uptake
VKLKCAQFVRKTVLSERLLIPTNSLTITILLVLYNITLNMANNAPRLTKWVAISGSRAITSDKVEKDVLRYVHNILKEGGGIVTGGALNVDSFATDETIKFDPMCKYLKIFLPTTLKIYSAHYRKQLGRE